jgi:serine-aspartate repeat-containing protein C/D/E
VGLLSLWRNWRNKSRRLSTARGVIKSEIRQLQAGRYCRFEVMEERRLLDADPIRVGVTYLEDDSGHDANGDTFQISFQGGAPGTELTHLVIDGDHYAEGLSFGDMIFDTAVGGLGADGAFPFKVISSTGITSVQANVVDGSSLIEFNFQGFHAGEKLIFTIDVDEMQELAPGTTDLNTINEGMDPIASGVEFQGSQLRADFKAPHYYDKSGTGEFRNVYDPLFNGSSLLISQGSPNGLPHDDHLGQRDRSTGVMVNLQQIPLPASIRGRVHLTDRQGNCFSEEALASPLENVKVTLKDANGNIVATQFTNQNGEYAFEQLLPGTYTIVEETPVGLIDGADHIGTVDGVKVGTKPGNDIISTITLNGGDDGINYDFCEHLPASVSGHVYHDVNDNGIRQNGEDPIPGTTVILFDASGTQIATTTTDSTGFYKFSNLSAGNYYIREVQPGGWIDGKDAAGTILGQVVGSAQNPGDQINGVNLLWGDNGINYDFGEHLPASVSGHVYHDANNNGIRENEDPIANVTVTLFNASGTQIATTTTDSAGFYKFENLVAGTYFIRETQPATWIDGKDAAGTINGQVVGAAQNPGDQISAIALNYNQHGIDYDFGEIKPGSIRGHVKDDPDCATCDCGEVTGEHTAKPIAGVIIQLLDANGNIIRTTTTNQNGEYEFTDLVPGTYSVRELQPEGYLQSGQSIGTGGGDATVTDLFTSIVVGSGNHFVNYDFCEMLPVTIAGTVWVDINENCDIDPNEQRLGGVTIQLFDTSGAVIATTTTAADGTYEFINLRPGTYSLHEVQPDGYFDGCTEAGSLGGDDTVNDNITTIVAKSGDNGVNYNFGEVPPAELSGYVFRDGAPIVTTDGLIPGNLYEIRDGLLTQDDLRLGGVVLELRYTLTGELVRGEDLLPGLYPSGPVRAVTDSTGYYHFGGLRQGNYSVFETQPTGYADSRDTAGTTNGLAVNVGTFVNPLMVLTFAAEGVSFKNDAILQVPLATGQHSQLNNFSEVQVVTTIIPDPPPQTPPLPPPPQPFLLQVLPPPPPPEVFIPPVAATIVTGGGAEFTWHLSVIDAGLPRVARRSTRMADGLAFRPALWIERTEWDAERLRDGVWMVHGSTDAGPLAAFGLNDAIPVTGDFNGDGRDEIAIFHKGEWFIDLNGNGQWDAQDLWAKLGNEHDRPVTGDWDGDGKDDIGIYGPKWPGDDVHIEHDPGLPDQDNQLLFKPRAKNVPPNPEQATDGERLMRLTSQGKERADLIDHVFEFGGHNDIPIAGDWNGDGIRSIGVFRDGKWHFDLDGDGRWSDGDKTAVFGEKGDLPVVGDFNGDGIEEIAIFRSGKWIIDSNGNREIDSSDQVVQFGQAGDKPIAGDFNGDGVDEPGVYRPNSK